MKTYPKHNVPKEDAGYTAEELLKGQHWLTTDVTCTNPDCRKVHALSNTVGDRQCVKCGARCD